MKRRDFIAALAAAPAVPTAASGQQRASDSPPPVKPLTITLLGTGTPAPSLARQSSGYLIEVGADLIVWDHGPGAHQRLIESGHRTIDTTHAFFTHLHYAHSWTTDGWCCSGGIRARIGSPTCRSTDRHRWRA